MKKSYFDFDFGGFCFRLCKNNTRWLCIISTFGNSGKVVSEASASSATTSSAAATPAANQSEGTGAKHLLLLPPLLHRKMGQSTFNAKCGKCHGLKPAK